MDYKRPEQLPARLRKYVWTPPQRTTPIDLALPKVGEAMAERFRTERKAQPVTPVIQAPESVVLPEPALAPASVVSIQIKLPKIQLSGVKNLVVKTTKPLRAVAGGIGKAGRVYRTRLAVSAAVLAVLMLSGGVMLGQRQTAAHKSATAATTTVLAAAAKAQAAPVKPAFTPLAPVDSTNNAVHGTPQVAYDAKRNTYSFTDTIKGNAIVVSQQPIPASYKTAVDAVSKIAVSLKATQAVTTSGSTAFIATDPKSNAQTVVFSKNNLLVFVQSPFTHVAADWQTYINGLKTQ